MTTLSEVQVTDRSMLNASFLDIVESSKNPAMHYRWVRVDETMMSHSKHKLLGYKPVQRGEVETISEPLEKGGTNIVVGDLMLMCCPKEVYEARQAAKKQRVLDVMESTSREVEEVAKSKGIKMIHDSDHNKESQ